MSARNLLTALVKSRAEVSPSTLTMLHAAAKRAKDVETLTALASRSDLPEAVAAALAKETTAKVRIAYLSRPGHSAETLEEAIRGEKRVKVLEAVARAEETGPETIRILADVAPGSPVLARALVEAVATPADVRYRALVRLVSTGHGNWWLRSVIAAHPDIHDAIAKGIGTDLTGKQGIAHYLEVVLTSPSVSEAGQVNLYEQLLAPLLAEAKTNPRRGGYPLESLVLALAKRPVMAQGLRERLEAVAADPRSPLASRTLTALKQSLANRSTSDPADTLATLESASRSSDPATLGAMVDRVVSSDENGPEQRALAETLAANTALAQADLVKLVPRLSQPTLHSVVRRPSRSDDLAVAVYSHLPGEMGYGNAFDGLDDPDAVRRRVATNLTAKEASSGAWRAFLVGGGATRETLVQVPWTTLASAQVASAVGNYAAVFDALLTDHLGDDLARWETFTSLSGSFAGTFGDLLEATTMLAAGES